MKTRGISGAYRFSDFYLAKILNSIYSVCKDIYALLIHHQGAICGVALLEAQVRSSLRRMAYTPHSPLFGAWHPAPAS